MNTTIPALVALAILQAAPSAGALMDGEQVVVSDQAFADRVRGAHFILLGEGRHNACDHDVQARLLDVIARAGIRPVLGLEMVAVDQQGVLDLFHERRIPVDRLDQALNWQQNWSVPFQRYLPVLERAEAWHLPVVGLNIPNYLVFLMGQGRLQPETVRPRSLLPPELPPMPRGDVPMLEEDLGAEGQFVPPFVPAIRSAEDIQYLHAMQDSQMAFVAQQAAKRHAQPVLIVAGARRVASGAGIAEHLQQAASAIIVVLPWRGGAPPDPTSADLFFYCAEE